MNKSSAFQEINALVKQAQVGQGEYYGAVPPEEVAKMNPGEYPNLVPENWLEALLDDKVVGKDYKAQGITEVPGYITPLIASGVINGNEMMNKNYNDLLTNLVTRANNISANTTPKIDDKWLKAHLNATREGLKVVKDKDVGLAFAFNPFKNVNKRFGEFNDVYHASMASQTNKPPIQVASNKR